MLTAKVEMLALWRIDGVCPQESGWGPISIWGLMMRTRYWLLTVLCSISMHAYAQNNAELYLSDESLQGQYATGADLIGLRAGELSAAVFINEEDDVLAAVGLNFTGQPVSSMSPWTFSAGPKLYASTLDIFDDNFAALAVGATAGYVPPIQWPVQLTGQFYYAPKLFTAGDVKDLMDFIGRIELPFAERLTGFLGYRLLQADLEDGGDHELDDNFHLGVRFYF
jgi:hypothetical protein